MPFMPIFGSPVPCCSIPISKKLDGGLSIQKSLAFFEFRKKKKSKTKRLLTDLVSVDFSVLLSRFSTSFCGGSIRKLIQPPQKEPKSGQNNPKTRRNPNPLTVS